MKERDQSSKAPLTAEELLSKLEKDPNYRKKIEEIEKQKKANMKEYTKDAKPILKELYGIGYRVKSIGELHRSGNRYHDAMPILMKWLGKTSNKYLNLDIIRTLSTPWAEPEVAHRLLDEFTDSSDSDFSYLWTIANTLDAIAEDSAFERILLLAKTPKYGKAREMLVSALGNMKNPRATKELLEFLEDEDLTGFAILGLRKLNFPIPLDSLQRIATSHPVKWVREEAQKGL